MARKKIKTRRYFISVTQEQEDAINAMTKAWLLSGIQGFFDRMLTDAWTEYNKKGAGRPKKEPEEGDLSDVPPEFRILYEDEPDWTDDLPKDRVWYGKKRGAKEMDWIMRRDEARKKHMGQEAPAAP